MSKKDLIKAIVDQLVSELQRYINAAHFARAEATHEQSKAEHKYDTRGLEASYLARGQSKQAAEIEQAIAEFEKLKVRDFGATEGIDLGAFVELKSKEERSFYFVGPRAGGTEVTFEGNEVMVITPQSPLGQEILGKKKGEKFKRGSRGNVIEYKVAEVL